jgi:hypothetical protein
MAERIPGQDRAGTAPVQSGPDEGVERDRQSATPLTVDDMYTKAQTERSARLGSDTFYHSDRPDDPTMFEDRPRGGGGRRLKHQKSWVSVALVIAFFVVIIMGMALFA